MEAFLQQIASGLANGCIYGSVALALVMIYQSTHHINFAQGEMATFSTFVAWAMVQAGWPYWGAFFDPTHHNDERFAAGCRAADCEG